MLSHVLLLVLTAVIQAVSAAPANVCSSGIYQILSPLSAYPPAQSYCSSEYPMSTVTVWAKRDVLTAPATTTKSATTTTTSCASGTNDALWSAFLSTESSIVKTFCSCIETPMTMTMTTTKATTTTSTSSSTKSTTTTSTTPKATTTTTSTTTKSTTTTPSTTTSSTTTASTTTSSTTTASTTTSSSTTASTTTSSTTTASTTTSSSTTASTTTSSSTTASTTTSSSTTASTTTSSSTTDSTTTSSTTSSSTTTTTTATTTTSSVSCPSNQAFIPYDVTDNDLGVVQGTQGSSQTVSYTGTSTGDTFVLDDSCQFVIQADGQIANIPSGASNSIIFFDTDDQITASGAQRCICTVDGNGDLQCTCGTANMFGLDSAGDLSISTGGSALLRPITIEFTEV